MNIKDEEYCPICDDYFQVDQHTGEINCDCMADPYKNDPHKELSFED